MKKLIFTLSICFFIFSCGSKTENNLIVKGAVKGLKKGTLYLQHVPDTVLVTIDSLQINGNGDFTFETFIESPEILYLYLNKKDNNDINDRITFFAEPGTITIKTQWNSFDSNAKVTGSKSNETLEEYRKTMSNINKRNLEIMMNASQSNQVMEQAKIDSLENLNNRNTQRGYAFAINFALNNKDSYVAPYIASQEIPDANIKYLDSIYYSLTPEVMESKYGKDLKSLLENRK